jgi:ubiquinone/menaquinone biosynthesis C-methylase UbiE
MTTAYPKGAGKTSTGSEATNAVSSTFDGRVDLFGHTGQARMYIQFRPDYTAQVVDSVAQCVPESKRGLYVDVACGPGILTKKVAPYFRRTLGIDMSLEQLGEAPMLPGFDLKFVAGDAFALPVESGSVDLVTVAQGLHWLVPYDKFFSEVSRILKPGGAFVAVAYAFPRLLNEQANAAVQRFYKDLLGGHLKPGHEGCWWETNRPTIDGFYTDIPFPRSTRTDHFPETKRMLIADYANYLRTLSAYRTLLRAGQPDPMPDLEKEIREAVNGNEVQVEIPYFTVSFTL